MVTPGLTALVFSFVFADKLTGPLGQSAIDTVLLSLLRGGVGSIDGGVMRGGGVFHLPANGLWTFQVACRRWSAHFASWRY